MKRVLWSGLAVVALVASSASAQSYKLEFSGDASASSCVLASGGVGLSKVHVILTGSGGATGVLFGAQVPACWAGATWVADNLAMQVVYPDTQNPPTGDVWLAIGNSQDPIGLSIAFTACVDLPIHIGSIDFMGTAPSPCCEFVTTHPSAWTSFSTPAQVADCNFQAHNIAGGSVTVSSGPLCPCQQALATEQSTWGRVKSLYR